MATTIVTAADIQRAAMVRLGVAEAGVSRHLERDPEAYDQRTTWFGLSIRRASGDDWELIGRRRTLAELLTMVETLNLARVDGKCRR